MARRVAKCLVLFVLVETAGCFYAGVGFSSSLRSIQPGAAKAIAATSRPAVESIVLGELEKLESLDVSSNQLRTQPPEISGRSMARSSAVATGGPALADVDEELRSLVYGDRMRRQLRHRSQIV